MCPGLLSTPKMDTDAAAAPDDSTAEVQEARDKERRRVLAIAKGRSSTIKTSDLMPANARQATLLGA